MIALDVSLDCEKDPLQPTDVSQIQSSDCMAHLIRMTFYDFVHQFKALDYFVQTLQALQKSWIFKNPAWLLIFPDFQKSRAGVFT